MAAPQLSSLVAITNQLRVATGKATLDGARQLLPAIYQIALEIWIGQQRVAAERQRLNHLVTAELRAARPRAVSTSDWRRLRDVARDIHLAVSQGTGGQVQDARQ